MKLLTTNNDIVTIPAHGALVGIHITEVTFDVKDIENILNAKDDQIRTIFEKLLTRFPPSD